MRACVPKRWATASRSRSAAEGGSGQEVELAPLVEARGVDPEQAHPAAVDGREQARGHREERVARVDAAGSVSAWVRVRNVSSRYLRVTVRPRRPWARSRRATPSLSRRSVPQDLAVGGVLPEGALLADALRLALVGDDGPVVDAPGELHEVEPVRAEPALERRGVAPGQVADRVHAEAQRASSIRGPTPHRRRTGRGARNAASVPGGPPRARRACACPRRSWPRACTAPPRPRR